jgi:hypothetical protein
VPGIVAFTKRKTRVGKHKRMPENSNVDLQFMVVNYQVKRFRQSQRREKLAV